MEVLYTLISEEKLYERLNTLSLCLSLPIQLLNESGIPLQQHNAVTSYCSLLKKNIVQVEDCSLLRLKAGQIASALGKSYIFSCHADLNHIAFPLVNRELLWGTIIIGPFLMDTPDSTLISKLAEKHQLSANLCLNLYDELRHIPVISPKRVTLISQLADYIFAPLLSDERLLMQERQEKLYQQSRINETIQMYKGESPTDAAGFIYYKEKELLSKVKICDMTSARSVLNDLLGFVFFSEGRNIALIKSRALELTTLLSRVAIEGGAPADRILPLNHAFLTKIQGCPDDEELCFILQEIVESFIDNISLPEQGCKTIKMAIEYISTHFHEPLSLKTLADRLSLSPAYFSSLFSKQMNIGFQDYLTMVRVEEAKRLLSATAFPISQIAVSVGYADQSSFTKAFKRTTGMTPSQMR